jgi:anti-anti-sigma factor
VVFDWREFAPFGRRVDLRMPKGEVTVGKPILEPSAALGVVSDASLTIQIIHDRREARLVPIGELDVQSSGTFSVAAQLAVFERPEHLHIDLSQVTFIDSSGARSVYEVVALAAEHGVPCTIIGREELLDRSLGADRDSITVWSGNTTRRVDVPTID